MVGCGGECLSAVPEPQSAYVQPLSEQMQGTVCDETLTSSLGHWHRQQPGSAPSRGVCISSPMFYPAQLEGAGLLCVHPLKHHSPYAPVLVGVSASVSLWDLWEGKTSPIKFSCTPGLCCHHGPHHCHLLLRCPHIGKPSDCWPPSPGVCGLCCWSPEERSCLQACPCSCGRPGQGRAVASSTGALLFVAAAFFHPFNSYH